MSKPPTRVNIMTCSEDTKVFAIYRESPNYDYPLPEAWESTKEEAFAHAKLIAELSEQPTFVSERTLEEYVRDKLNSPMG
jgi:hypothetical protein